MRVVGLCGGIGAGKSTVARLLAERHNATVIDVDGLGRQVLEIGGGAYDGVVSTFGPQVVAGDGTIDRARLGELVFADPDQLSALEAISHPAINAALDEQLAALADGTFVVLDMAILVESKLGQDLPSGRGYDTVVVVEADLDVRVERLTTSRGMSRTDIEARMASQATDEQRRAVAHHVVTNNGDQQQLAAAVDQLVAALFAGEV